MSGSMKLQRISGNRCLSSVSSRLIDLQGSPIGRSLRMRIFAASMTSGPIYGSEQRLARALTEVSFLHQILRGSSGR